MSVPCWMLVPLGLSTSAYGRDWTEEPWGEATATQLLKAAEAAPDPEDAGLALLLDEDLIHVAEGGRRDWRSRQVYQLRRPDSVDNWSHVRACWYPWYQERPEVLVRVISPDGRVSITTSDDLHVSSNARGDDHRVYSDLSCLEGAIANTVVGSVVEETVRVRDHRAYFGGFASGSEQMEWLNLSVGRRRFTLTADPGVEVQLLTEGGALEVSRRRTQQGLRFQVTEDDVAPVPAWQRELPLDRLPGRTLLFHTAPSWAVVADTYRSAVEDKFDPSGLEDLVAEVKAAPDAREAIRRALRGVQARLRYTGLELGEQALIPYRPGECVDRGFGDCKDQSTAFVTVLRAAGYDADVALVHAGITGQRSPTWTSLRRFNHAIAVVHTPGGAVWVDPVDPYSAVGSLSRSKQGRFALILRPGTDRLVETPREVSVQTETLRVDASRSGWANLVEEVSATGDAALSLKSLHYAATPGNWRPFGEAYATERYAGTFQEMTLDGAAPDDALTRRTIRLTDSNMAVVLATEGKLLWTLGEEWTQLPFPNRDLVNEGLRALAAGAEPVGIRMAPSVRERTAIWTLPPGWEPDYLPDGYNHALGELRLAATFSFQAPELRLTFRNETGSAPLTLQQQLALLDLVDKLDRQIQQWSLFIRPTDQDRFAADPVGVLAQWRRTQAAHPDQPLAWTPLVHAYVKLGFAEEAIALADQLTVRFPEEPGAWRAALMAHAAGRMPGTSAVSVDVATVARLGRAIVQHQPDDHHAVTGWATALLAARQMGIPVDLELRKEALATHEAHFPDDQTNGEVLTVRLRLLAALDRWSDIADLPFELLDSPASKGVWMAARVLQGRDSPKALMRRLGVREFGSSLEHAHQHLMIARRYDLSAELFQTLAQQLPDPRIADDLVWILRRAEPWESVAAEPTLRGACVQFFARGLGLLPGDPNELLVGETFELPAATQLFPEGTQDLGMPKSVMLDMYTTGDQTTLARDVARYQIVANGVSTSIVGERRGGQWRILAAQKNEGGVAARLWDALEAGDSGSARLWRDELQAFFQMPGAKDPGVLRLIGPTATPAQVRAAALIESLGVRPNAATGVLPEVLAELSAEDRQWAWVRGNHLGKFNDASQRTQAWHEAFLSSPGALSEDDKVRAWTMLGCRSPSAARRVIDSGEVPLADQVLLWNTVAQDDLEAGIAGLEQVYAVAPEEAFNDLAWFLLVRAGEGDAERAVALVEASRELQPALSEAVAHTYAVGLLDLGRIAEALSVYTAHGDASPGSSWNQVRGGLAEAAGLPDAARAAYRDTSTDDSPTTRIMVERALARIGD